MNAEVSWSTVCDSLHHTLEVSVLLTGLIATKVVSESESQVRLCSLYVIIATRLRLGRSPPYWQPYLQALTHLDMLFRERFSW